MPERYLGRTLGRFRTDSLIGSGGFAWVYRGYDPDLDIPVAVKVLKPQYAGEPAFEERFRGEATTAAKLRHPNIVRILTVGRDDDAVYFAMDYLPASLDEKLRVLGTLPEPILLRLALDVAAALSFAHREGVIHRDIKTDNVLYDAHGNAVVVDFGIARAAADDGARTGTNMVVGTPQYFAPEQARGLPIDGRADLYALGVTLFRAATGSLPFLGHDWYEVARQHVEDPPPPPRSLAPSLSPAFERVILTCLEKRPEDRYASADALREALHRVAGFAPPGAEPTLELAAAPAARRWYRRAGRRRVLLAGAGFAVAAASIALVLRTRGAARDAPAAADAAPSGTMLHVVAPPGAAISLDGVAAGAGEVARSVGSGVHHVVALLPSDGACPWARAETSATVPDTGSVTLHLAPSACGWLAADVQPVQARWSVTTPGGSLLAAGRGRSGAAIPLPAGTWSLRVSAPYCADYRAPVRIETARTSRARVRLMCGTGP